MSLWNAFAHWSVGAEPGTPAHEVVAEARQFLARAAEHHEATLVTLDGQAMLGWHPELGAFDIVRKRADAPDHLPEFMARLMPESRIHQGGNSPEEAVSLLLKACREAAEPRSPLG